MAKTSYSDFHIQAFRDGSLYRARVRKKDDTLVTANGKTSKVWETSQCPDPETAIGQARFAIDTHKVS